MAAAAPHVVESGRTVTLEPRGAVARLGLIALSTDLTFERDAARLIPPDRAGMYTARVFYENPTTPENLRRMAPRLTEAAALLVPGIPLAAICYACTSASVTIGEEAVDAAIGAARPGVPVVTPPRAARWAFAALGIRRIALLTPYLRATTEPMADYFAGHGLTLAGARCLGMADDRDMGRIDRETLLTEVREADAEEAEALFISCTAVPALAMIPELEAALGKPVVSSNLACLWAMLALAGVEARGGLGSLSGRPLPAGLAAAWAPRPCLAPGAPV